MGFRGGLFGLSSRRRFGVGWVSFRRIGLYGYSRLGVVVVGGAVLIWGYRWFVERYFYRFWFSGVYGFVLNTGIG